MWGGKVLNQLLLAWVSCTPVPLSGFLLFTIVPWQSFLRVSVLREGDGDCGGDNRPVKSDMEAKLNHVRSGLRGKGKIGCMNCCVHPSGTLELSPRYATVGIWISAKEGAIWI